MTEAEPRPTTSARRGRPTTARRDEILAGIVATATELFAQRGYHATGVAEIGRATGLGAGALYHYIGSKEELLFTILTGHTDQVVEFGRAVQERDTTAVEKLHELARGHMRVVATRPLELLVLLRELDSLTGERHDEMMRRRDAAEQIWDDVLCQGQQNGELGPVDPMFVKITLGALNYTALWYRSDGDTGAEEIGDRIVGMLLAGQERLRSL